MRLSDAKPGESRSSERGANKPTRQSQLHRLLTRKSGASIAQMQKAFGWQPHTARAAISAQRKAGFEIARRDTGKGSIYWIVDRSGAQ